MLCSIRLARAWLVSFFALAIMACSSSGGGSSTPLLPWGRLRGTVGNSAVGSGALVNNLGMTALRIPLGPGATVPGIDGMPVAAGSLTEATPLIGVNGLIYLGTTAGILVTRTDGTQGRVFNSCTFLGQNIAVGEVHGTPAININDDVVFNDDTGRLFAFHDDGTTFECLWANPAPVTPAPGVPTPAPTPGVPTLSSPVLFSDVVDRSLATTLIGTGDGELLALNNFGTPQWRFPDVDHAFDEPLSSSPATDGQIVHITAPNGVLYSLDRGGRLQHQAIVSVPMPNTELLPSPMASISTVYATGIGGRCGDTSTGCLEQRECDETACDDIGTVGIITALTTIDEVRWRFATHAPIAGSAAFGFQTLNEPVPATPTRTGMPTPTPTPLDNPTATPTPTTVVLVVQGVVYLLDTEGTVYVLKDSSGDLFEVPTSTPIPGSPTPTPVIRMSKVQLKDPVTVTTSPVVSSDFFIMYGTYGADDGGELYAIRPDFERTIPCVDCNADERNWRKILLANNELGGGKVPIPRADGQPGPGDPIVSAPVIDRDGTVYLTAGDIISGKGALYAVGTL